VEVDFDRIYHVGEGFKRGAFRVRSDAVDDPFALTRAETRPRKPIPFVHVEGRRLYDYVGTTWAALKLVSERVIEALEGFSGWRTYAVEIRDRNGTIVPGYRGLAVTGRCGAIDPKLSEVKVLPPPVPEGEAGPYRIGWFFHSETWDGSDVFVAGHWAAVFITEPVRDALVAAKVTNMVFEPISRIETPVIDD
jgi:hypothetical protein